MGGRSHSSSHQTRRRVVGRQTDSSILLVHVFTAARGQETALTFMSPHTRPQEQAKAFPTFNATSSRPINSDTQHE